MTKGQDLGVDVDAFCTGDMEVVETKYGPVSVTISGDRRLSPIITYHEVGTNHTTAFQSLIMATNPTSLFLANHCFYHIDAPGSEEGATTVCEGMIPMTLEKLSDQVAGVVTHYHLSEVVGLGVGVGASILLMYAAIHPTKVAGLILISPAVLPTSSPLAFANLDILTGGANQLTASAWEGTIGSSVVKGLWAGSNAGWIRDHFVARLFGKRHQSSSRQSDLVRAFRRDIERIPAKGLMQLLQAALNRSSLLPLAKKIKCRTLLVWGGHSHYRFEARKLNTVMPPGRCHFMEMDDCGTLVPAEDPNSLLSPINLFLLNLQQEGFGLAAQAGTAPAAVQQIHTPSTSIWA